MIAKHLEFLVSFLPADTRRLSRTGIQIHCLEYWSDQLAPWVGEKRDVLVHYDPRDISVLYVRTPGGAIVVATVKTREIGPISLVEWDFRRAIERGMGRDSALVAMADESLKRSDELVAQSKRKRSVERRAATRAAGDRLLPPQATQSEPERVPAAPDVSTVAVIYSIEGMDDEF
jgi:putative transposase